MAAVKIDDFAREVKMTFFAFRGVKSHGWTFYDPLKIWFCQKPVKKITTRPKNYLRSGYDILYFVYRMFM